jgi:hypothetical protein
MPNIQAVCTACGSPVHLEPDGVLMFTWNGSVLDGTYLFFCGACEQVVVRPVHRQGLSLLAVAGVRDHGCATVRDGARRGGLSRPLAPDDVNEFRHLLARDDWFAKLLNGTYGASA